MSDINERRPDPADRDGAAGDHEFERDEPHDPDALLLTDFLFGDLDAATEQALVRRLANEPALSKRLADLSAIVTVVQWQADVRKAEQGATPPNGTTDGAGAASSARGRFARFVDRWGMAQVFVLGCGLSLLAGIQLHRLWQDETTLVRRDRVDSSKSVDTTTVELTGRMRARLDPGGLLSYELPVTRPFQSTPQTPEAVTLDGSAWIELHGTSEEPTEIVTPFVTVKMYDGMLRIDYEPPCTTRVAMASGSATVTPRRSLDEQPVFQAQALRIACDGRITRATPVLAPWEFPVHVDSVVER